MCGVDTASGFGFSTPRRASTKVTAAILLLRLPPESKMGEVMRASPGLGKIGFFAVFTLVASGCASLRPYDPGPGKRVAATVARDTYLSGESVNVTIANLSEVTLFYRDGACKTELQRRDGSSWKTVLEQSSACSIALGFLDPGQAIVRQYRLPKGVAVGTYRLTLPMPAPEDDTGAQSELETPTFTVQTSSQ
jgi:hypothetical protein